MAEQTKTTGDATAGELSPPSAKPIATVSRCRAHHLYTTATHAQNKGGEGDLVEARRLLDQSLAVQSTHAFALFRRGTIQLGLRELGPATADLEAALALEPEMVFAHYNLACAHSLAGDVASARDSLVQALDAGYRNFSNIERDEDLARLRAEVDVAKLVGPYKSDGKTLAPSQRFQTMTSLERIELLLNSANVPREQLRPMAALATVDAAFQVRTLGFGLQVGLADGDYRDAVLPALRMAAAGALARLEATEAIPDVEAALRNLPDDDGLREIYRIEVGTALERLRP